MKVLLKVDIQSGQVLVDHLAANYARQSMGEGRPDPVWRDNPAISRQPAKSADSIKNQNQFKRICAYNRKRRKTAADSWDEHSMHLLARLARGQSPFNEIAARLGRKVKSCQNMYHALKKAGIVEGEVTCPSGPGGPDQPGLRRSKKRKQVKGEQLHATQSRFPGPPEENRNRQQNHRRELVPVHPDHPGGH